MDEHPVLAFYRELSRLDRYPAGVVRVRRHVRGIAFFPGGPGLWEASSRLPFPPFPRGGTMIIGHNYDCETSHARSLARGKGNLTGPSWRGLVRELTGAGVSLGACFFTNLYVGLIEGNNPCGPFPGRTDAEFVAWCRAFLLRQIREMAPRVVLTLGRWVPDGISSLAPRLVSWAGKTSLIEVDRARAAVIEDVWFLGAETSCTVAALTHPSQWEPNVLRREFGRLKGRDAERAIVGAAVRSAKAVAL